MQIISLESLIKASEEESEVREFLSSFKCVKNKDVELFLHTKAIENEKRSFTRTSLVLDEENNNEIVGYFSLMIKHFNFHDVSKTSKKLLTGNKNADIFNSILIAQLGRSDLYKGKVEGKKILLLALGNCLLINKLSGIRIVCVEYDDEPILNDFYLGNDFKILQTNASKKILAYMRL
ncbi:hypothetical protein [Bacillus sp. FJAT-27251]|uniref:hypothetical protein n=1 Tax=Bacillus sp. FJAT-27251 TaxID=1684142 RepID=UPI0006A7E789|nr:hypothetical protein [Bacillus sp. FJAT-27251]